MRELFLMGHILLSSNDKILVVGYEYMNNDKFFYIIIKALEGINKLNNIINK